LLARLQRLSSTPSEVCSPSAFSQPQRATYLPAIPKPPVQMRPQGFAPSRRFAPFVTCRAYSIPIPHMGFPFEVFIRKQRRSSSRTSGPSGLRWLCSQNRYLPFRVSHTLPTARPRTRVLARFTVSVPPWAHPFEALHPSSPTRAASGQSLPLSYFAGPAFKLTVPPVPQGIRIRRTETNSLESVSPPWVFPPR
jgi:hypothetical protein